MNRDDTIRMPEAFIKAVGLAQAHHAAHAAAAQLPALTVALSREAGALGTSVAKGLGQALGWRVYDHALLEQMAEEMHIHVELLESIDERHVPWLLERMESFSAIPYVSENTYVRRLLETMLALGARGNCIIVGRGAPHVLPATTTLRVRLVAQFDDRVRVIASEEGLSSAEASRRVRALDRQRTAFLKDHFHIDPNCPENYDLLLNTSRFSVDTCCELIQIALRARERERRREHVGATT